MVKVLNSSQNIFAIW